MFLTVWFFDLLASPFLPKKSLINSKNFAKSSFKSNFLFIKTAGIDYSFFLSIRRVISTNFYLPNFFFFYILKKNFFHYSTLNLVSVNSANFFYRNEKNNSLFFSYNNLNENISQNSISFKKFFNKMNLINFNQNYLNFKLKGINFNVKYSVSDFFKYLNNFSLEKINVLFLRKNKVFNKGRYSRNRQYYRTGVY